MAQEDTVTLKEREAVGEQEGVLPFFAIKSSSWSSSSLHVFAPVPSVSPPAQLLPQRQ